MGATWLSHRILRLHLYTQHDTILYILGETMKQAAFTELRNNAKLFFDQVEAGETVRILRNGKPIADIVPILSALPSWKRRTAAPLVVSGASLSRLILEERGQKVSKTTIVATRTPKKR
jgi:antitoxin (DNA-binding transcriptional repressor) of toxin-antitoxin stability system